MQLNHIYHMDCLEGMKEIPEKSIDMVLCDLPYGVTARNRWDVVIPFETLWTQYWRLLKHNGVVVLTAKDPFTLDVINSMRAHYKYRLVWRKNLKSGHLNARERPMSGYEDILVFYQSQPTYNPQRIPRTTQEKSGNKHNTKSTNYGVVQDNYVDRQSDWIMPDDVIEFDCVHNTNKLHPTQKPVTLFEYLIRTYTNENGTVLDNCMGSGTTAVACIRSGRNFIGFEKEAKYVEIANARINGFVPVNQALESEYSQTTLF